MRKVPEVPDWAICCFIEHKFSLQHYNHDPCVFATKPVTFLGLNQFPPTEPHPRAPLRMSCLHSVYPGPLRSFEATSHIGCAVGSSLCLSVRATCCLEMHLTMLCPLQGLFGGKCGKGFLILLFITIIILYNDQQTHNYITATRFHTILSSSDSLQSALCQVAPVFHLQLSVIQFTVKVFHVGFVQLYMRQCGNL